MCKFNNRKELPQGMALKQHCIITGHMDGLWLQQGISCDIKWQQGFLISASPSCLTQADCSAQLGGRSAAAAAVKRWATNLSEASYPSSKRGLQANHTQLSRATLRSTSSMHKHKRKHRDERLPFPASRAKGDDRK